MEWICLLTYKFIRMKNVIYFLLVVLFFVSCTENIKIEKVLEDSGCNRLELLKVLGHYKNNKEDSLKYKAALFLIENMNGHYSKTNKALEYMTRKFNQADTIITNYRQIRKWWIPFKRKKCIDSMLYDLNYLKSDFLIDNIDAAYNSWINAPWHDDVTFDDFCNYILPYRFEEEPVALGWRDSLRNEYGHLIVGESDLKKAFATLKNVIWNRTRRENPKFPLLMDVLTMRKQGAMNCRQGCVFLGDIARSLGMPVVMDKVLQWSNYSKQGHNWIALSCSGKTFTVKDGDTIAKSQNVIDASSFPDEFKLNKKYPLNTDFRKTVSKIYRCLFVDTGNEKYKGIPEKWKFMDTHYVDVSKDYGLNGHFDVHLDDDSCFVYLCNFWDSPYWTPVTCEKITNNIVSFNSLGDSIVYLPMKYRKQKLVPLSNPIILLNNNVRLLNPCKKKKHKVVLTRKYPFSNNWTNKWGKLIGGKFEASNDSLFITKRTLYWIDNVPMFRNVINFNENKKYRYIRYLSNAEANQTLSEVQFLSDSCLCVGQIFGNTSSRSKAFFDGNLTNDDDNDVRGYYVGMDLGCRKKISQLIYYPVNDGNFVIPNMEYELFYYDYGWISLGKKIANDFFLVYDNVPQNALLLLRNRTEGNEERIFTYENGKQIWW